MRLGNILVGQCANLPIPPDARCLDDEFRLLNPTICPTSPVLIIKPSVGLVCRLGSIQLSAFIFANGVETDVTATTIFVSSNPAILVIGAHSGNATGIAVQEGSVTVTATNATLTASSEISVLGNTQCCGTESVAMMVVVDTSKSMSQGFGGVYPTRLDFAKAAATRFINEVNQQKDIVGLMNFNALDDDVLSVPISNKASVSAMVSGITQTQQSTTFFESLTTAVDALNATPADKKLLFLISDGEDQQPSYATNNPIALLNTFKSSGGIVMVLGARASGSGFARMEAFSTGGFFINGYSSVSVSALNYISGLKGYVCAGNCTPAGDVFDPTPELNYDGFIAWDVLIGQVNLIGPGLFDVLPGNGLYLAFDSTPCSITTKNTYAMTAGKTYRIRVSIAGNQKIDNGTATVTIEVGTAFSHIISLPNFMQPLTEYSFNFTVPADTTGKITLTGTIGTPAIAGWGPIIDNVSLDNVTDGVNLFTDTFDDENIQYIPPRCGLGTHYVPLDDLTNVLIDYNSPTFNNFDGVNDPIQPPTNNISTVAFGVPVSGAIVLGNVGGADQNVQFEVTQNSPNCLLGATGNVVVVFNYYPASDPTNQYHFAANYVGSPTLDLCQVVAGFDPGGPLAAGSQISFCVCSDPGFQSPPSPPQDGSSPYQIHIRVTSGDVFPAYGYMVGYYCYGTGCLSTPPGAQMPDPAALPDIERGFTPPTIYHSTKTACVSCLPGFANVVATSLAPVMTSNTDPSGTVSASSENASTPPWKAFTQSGLPWFSGNITLSTTPQWIQYQFPSAQIVTGYSILTLVYGPLTDPSNVSVTGAKPLNFVFQGSNDGTTWTTLDSQLSIYPFLAAMRQFQFTNTTAYLYYRITFSPVTGNDLAGTGTIALSDLRLLGPAPQQICIEESATSDVSQAAADTAAYTAAQIAAQGQLNCQQIFSSTEFYTAACGVDFALGTFGVDVTKTASAVSFNSQLEADNTATNAAKIAAIAALDCTLSNNTNQIIISDNTKASPYPSVQRITGLPGVITSMTVSIKKLTHTFPDDIIMVLRHPDGTTCYLMANCGGPNAISGVDLVFSDAAGSFLPDATIITSGTFKPTNYTPIALLPAPGPQPPIGTTLSVFNGKDPNVSFSLWVCDDSAANTGTILNGFSLNITSA